MGTRLMAFRRPTRLHRIWRALAKRDGRDAPTTVANLAASTEGAAARALAISPNDPVVAFFQDHPHVTEVAKLHFASPALAAMRAAGVQIAVPLVSQGELIGLLALGPRRSKQAYSSDDRHLLDNLAAHAAPSVRVAQLVQQQRIEVQAREAIEQEMRIAHLIQQTLLPRELPRMEGWQVDAHYQPARAVGGDFYDFIELPGDQVGIVVGDASDKGVPAALMMATTRTMLRASAQRSVSPAKLLGQANEALCQESLPNMFVTCLYAILDPVSGRLRYANAGHSLPYLLTPHDVVELRATGWPLGLMPGVTYEEKEATVGPGDTMFLYSDGLSEAHNPRQEMFGTPRLIELLKTRPAGEDLMDVLLTELRRFTGPTYELEDDTTLVIVQRSMRHGSAGPALASAEGANPSHTGERRRMLAEFSVPSEPGNERLVVARVVDALRDIVLPAARLERLKTAVAEATMNAIEHGNRSRPEIPVSIQVLASDVDLAVRVIDQGSGQAIPDPPVPDLEAKLAGLEPSRGWGLFLIKNMVDEMHTTSTESSHTIELILGREGGDDGNRAT
ncbi:MAG: ATP-binding SpoIIE family protein phosphatase [Thermomicrobiales bacterium]